MRHGGIDADHQIQIHDGCGGAGEIFALLSSQQHFGIAKNVRQRFRNCVLLQNDQRESFDLRQGR